MSEQSTSSSHNSNTTVSSSAFKRFIESLKTNRNILNENGLPNFWCDGWSVWNSWNGWIDNHNYKIRLSRLYIKPSNHISNDITKILKQLSRKRKLKIDIKEVSCKMINPDRCIYEAVLHSH